MNRQLRALSLALALVAGSCVSGPAAGGGDPSSNPDEITRDEIDRGQWSNAYELVRNLRPNWIRTRGPDSFENPGQVQVYVDGTRLGEVDLLRTLPTHAMDRLQWIDPVSAAGRWGLNHGHGVIYITYRRASGIDSMPTAGEGPNVPARRR